MDRIVVCVGTTEQPGYDLCCSNCRHRKPHAEQSGCGGLCPVGNVACESCADVANTNKWSDVDA